MNRRTFIKNTVVASASALLLTPRLNQSTKAEDIMTVTGPLTSGRMGFTLTHEHVMADFIGAAGTGKDRYKAADVYNKALPFLNDVKSRGCMTFVDCTPAYLGRDAQVLHRLAKSTGLNILTNTGYYGAVEEKFVPAHAYSETAQQLANRWIAEFRDGIEGTDIKPGFIKTSVDKAPLTAMQRKLIQAAALSHLATGLTIAIHSGDGKAAEEELEILGTLGVAPNARIWVHAQNEPDTTFHLKAAKQNSWVSLDGVNPSTVLKHIELLKILKKNGLLGNVLVSQDSGWYNVGEPNGGEFKNYNCIFTDFLPALKTEGFTQKEIDQIFIDNPAKAFQIRVRRL